MYSIFIPFSFGEREREKMHKTRIVAGCYCTFISILGLFLSLSLPLSSPSIPGANVEPNGKTVYFDNSKRGSIMRR